MPQRIDAIFKKKPRRFWLSTSHLCGHVIVDARGLISETPPEWCQFKRRALFVLTTWLKSQGPLEIKQEKN